jgi:hypothetical protein
MTARNLLVVLLEGGSRAELRAAIAEHGLPNVHIVAPARIGALAWLASDEDGARSEADVQALEAEWLLADDADVAGEGGDLDPVQAVEDALRDFPAEEILLVGGERENGGLEASLAAFGLPVTRVGSSGAPRRASRLREGTRSIVAGRSKATPFVFFAGANLALLLLAVAISLAVLLVLWLLSFWLL